MNRKQLNYQFFKKKPVCKTHKKDNTLETTSSFNKNKDATKEETSEPVSEDSEIESR